MLEKGGGFVVGIFPEGLVLSWESTQIAYILPFAVLKMSGKLFVNSTDTHLFLSHTVYNREIWGICKGYVEGWYAGLCPGMEPCSIRTCQFLSFP